ncbi:ferrochelatase [Vagococcus sp. PNs007]|uniref:Coproporphyrin III ferrochelatase n=1 Tax=Vagococcus proximus TaxID=2991417 RepID=A0ABT5WYQ7_9ENTE|nr:ferrochelatase [Vagococcus proximus]MDF0478890.1 ferrochelatase [Vagococcus proximus]
MKKKGILIANIGTPDKPEKKEVKHYLKQFLGDHRVIDTPRWKWLPILHGIILNTRPKKSAALYKEIWTEEGSPLLVYTKAQARLLQEQLPDYSVRFGMAYSEPSISDSLMKFEEEGIEEVTIIPLYPQYSTTTTASINDAVFKHYLKQENMPHLHFVREFTDHPLYIKLLAKQVVEGVQKYNPDEVIISYHGIPVSYVEKGDPYQEQCQATTDALLSTLEIDTPIRVCYQSKFGPAEWLTPALDLTLMGLPKKGIKKVLVITPGFVSDCIETIEEIESENHDYFMENGGVEFNYIHPFNDSPEFIDLLVSLVEDK